MSSLDRRSFLGMTAAGLGSMRAGRAAEFLDDDPLGVRDDFPITRNKIYLNTAYASPLPTIVREAGLEFLDDKTLRPYPGRGQEKADEARGKFADLFGAKREELALLYATSDGENIVARALDLRAGDNVVLDELHFTTSFVLYRALEKEKGIELRIVPQRDGRVRIEDFEARTDERTRLVSVAWVSNRNGYRQDVRALADLAHSHQAFLYVDAIQALGTFPTNLTAEGIDFLTSGAFKWLYASFGVAPFFVREEHLERLTPDRFGHGQVAQELRGFHFRIHRTAKKLEYAALANGPVYQLDAALGYLASVGLARIEKHGVALARELRDGIIALGFQVLTPPDNPSPIVSFVHRREPERLKRLFDEEDVVVSFREQGTQVRASVSLFNNRSEVRQFLQVLQRLA